MSYKLGAKYTKKFEGFRDFIYKDSLGNLTCGWGHYLAENSRVPKIIAHIFFKMDYSKARKDFKTLNLELDPARTIVIVDLLFNMGLNGVKKFKRMLAALRIEDYTTAAEELKDSLYYTQTKSRAKTNINILKTGELK